MTMMMVMVGNGNRDEESKRGALNTGQPTVIMMSLGQEHLTHCPLISLGHVMMVMIVMM